MKKIVTVIGARPQFIKAAAISEKLRQHFNEIIIHTGQHFDPNMSDVFFQQLNIPAPDYNLNLHSFSHGKLTGLMMIKVEEILLKEKPNYVLVYGDTNSTLAGALTAVKLGIPVIHVEAGARSGDSHSPEEVNRKITDHVASLLFGCTEYCIQNLKNEGIASNVFFTGDVMYDIFQKMFIAVKGFKGEELYFPFKKGDYNFFTVHRQENVDSRQALSDIINAILESKINTVFPIHPRTKSRLQEFGLMEILEKSQYIKLLPPLGYIETLHLQLYSNKIITDSGGVQREAYFLKKPCITLLELSPWPVLVNTRNAIVVGKNKEAIKSAIESFEVKDYKENLFGDGSAANKIVEKMTKML
ncbi:non-hydrolyzing UDP-N-acetylglucosamine 2-epimerase [Petroclostridium xylanilyticum]|uniref:non-hydrolyzing UDP-N-acetylglucosamine 2-epimerase n=1 Tax=Petroclostridium xylanilyticum TaxID=1792311 RepID=UPI000B994E00|nr:UDP-N-acetylglucosamine 2-epimerase (non-hydrolyzing) [Petroclostridium xylanilyticum]